MNKEMTQWARELLSLLDYTLKSNTPEMVASLINGFNAFANSISIIHLCYL